MSESVSESVSIRTQYSTSPTLVDNPAVTDLDDRDNIVRDLSQRVTNWAGADPTVLGHLCLHDTLKMRKGVQEKQFQVYLFKNAIICVVEQKRKRTLGSALHVFGSKSTFGNVPLTLKGRIFTKHMKRIVDTSTDDEWCLTIEMEDVKVMDSFTMIFSSQRSLNKWYSELSTALSDYVTSTYSITKR